MTYNPKAVCTFGFKANTDADVPSWGSFYGRPKEEDFPGFVKDATAGGSNDHKNGDYHLVDNAKLKNVPRLPASECAYSIDIFGKTVPLDGTALIGALQLILK